MSKVEFKEACAAHRKCCPYKATGMKKCGANKPMDEEGKCPIKGCHYMAEFRKQLKKYTNP